MSRFIESICVINGEPRLIDLHQQRVDQTFKAFLKGPPFKLSSLIVDPEPGARKKCRLIYAEEPLSLEWEDYTPKGVGSLKLIHHDTIDYSYKFYDRSQLNNLHQQKAGCDDIIIVKRGYITDSFFCNIVLYDGVSWFTPKIPLLPGVKRQYLINKGILKEAEIKESDLNNFPKVGLINSMIDLDEINVPVENIKS